MLALVQPWHRPQLVRRAMGGRWCSERFLDPLYTDGTDFIGLANSLATMVSDTASAGFIGLPE